MIVAWNEVTKAHGRCATAINIVPHPYGPGARWIKKMVNLRERCIAKELFIPGVPGLNDSIRLRGHNDDEVRLARFACQRCPGRGDDLSQAS